MNIQRTPLVIESAGGPYVAACFAGLPQADAVVDMVDEDGDTALHMAVRGGYLDTVMMLLHSGANPDIRNADGDAPVSVWLALVIAWLP